MHGTLSRSPDAGDASDANRGRPDATGPAVGDPFLNRPSPELFFAADPHRAAWTFLRRSLRRGVPFVLLTGDFGAGKTMLTLRLVRAIRERGLGPCVHMSTPAQGAAAVLRRTAEAAGLDPAALPGDAAGLAQAVHAHLVDEPSERRLFLVLEDPQDLEADALEQLLQAVPTARDGRAALTAVLIGHSSLPQLLQCARFRRFDTRIRRRHHLPPLDPQQTRAYIAFRLTQAGDEARPPLPDFDAAALDRVFELTHGNPREINNVCGTSLNQAMALRRPTVDQETVDAAARALGRPVPGPGRAAPVVVQFPAGTRTGRFARGSPDYVRARPPSPAGPGPELGSGAADAPRSRPDTPRATSPHGRADPTAGDAGSRRRAADPAWRPDRRLRAVAAGTVLLLAAAYLAAPYLTTDDATGVAGGAPGTGDTALSQAERREVEALLRSLDFDTGAVDGDLDPKTLDAIQAYKNMAGLTPAGASGADATGADATGAEPTVGRALLEDLRAVTGNLSRQETGQTGPQP